VLLRLFWLYVLLHYYTYLGKWKRVAMIPVGGNLGDDVIGDAGHMAACLDACPMLFMAAELGPDSLCDGMQDVSIAFVSEWVD
jgi:hypothetical protein